MEYKQAILVRADLKLSKGKMAAQASHASVEATLKSHKDDVKKWRAEGMKKVVLKVPDQKALFKYKQIAEDLGLVVALITDAGHTEIPAGTTTCLAIGPAPEEKIDEAVGKLPLI